MRVVGTMIVGVLGALAWCTVGSAPLGGTLTVVTVRGTSMHPGIVAGDLVVVRRNPPYRVGDVVAHRGTPDGSWVLHRVVAVHGDRLTLRGDANDHDDDIRPHVRDVVGRESMQLPHGERIVHQAPLAATAACGAMMLARPRRPRRRRRHPWVTSC